MTVCIAAICSDDGEDKIVSCTDLLVSAGVGSAETGQKDHYLAHGWSCLCAGVETEYMELIRLYRAQFKNPDALKPENIDFSMKEPLYKRKAELADEFTRSRYAISYDDFLKHGKQRFPDAIYFEVLQHINRIELDAELIIMGFIDGSPEIYYTSRDGKARAANNFATIGEGEYLASSVLLRRAQDSIDSLEVTLYNVYEAKRYAESVRSVGEYTNMAIRSASAGRQLTSIEADEQLAKLFLEFGPKDVPSNLKFEMNLYLNKINQDIASSTSD
jgi:hypothetical protein